MTAHSPRTGGQILVDQLVAPGVKRLCCVPGESYRAANLPAIAPGATLSALRAAALRRWAGG